MFFFIIMSVRIF